MKLILFICRIWGIKNPNASIQKPTHPRRVTVWCGFWSRGKIGLFFFENEQGEAVTVNGNRYRAVLFTNIEEQDIGNIWFQQDGATCHTAEAKLDVLHPVFEDRIISRRADVVWPPRSCDLTPLDYQLWGAVKYKCYDDYNMFVCSTRTTQKKFFIIKSNSIILYILTVGIVFMRRLMATLSFQTYCSTLMSITVQHYCYLFVQVL